MGYHISISTRENLAAQVSEEVPGEVAGERTVSGCKKDSSPQMANALQVSVLEMASKWKKKDDDNDMEEVCNNSTSA
ncbi:hypothetical protein PQX77_013427 [Marasmius sp. AFHP31]|nr:hypothetical protein PQX77_013427 [Marasmius sp. AFHP31]